MTRSVRGYFGVRTVRWGKYGDSEHSFVLLNGKPLYLRGVLDQSYNPEGLYTAPDDEFLKRDIELAKRAGFNMMRIHIKADEPRKLYWADTLGMLIQADIPCFFTPSARARALFEKTLRDQIRRDFNHPSIIAWTIFNEEWGLGRLDKANRERRVDWVLRMVALARELDPTRLIHDNSGWSPGDRPQLVPLVRTQSGAFPTPVSDGQPPRDRQRQNLELYRRGVRRRWRLVLGRTDGGQHPA